MLIALTGTPGTGKTSVADELANRGYQVMRAADTIAPYVLEKDHARDADVIDTERWVEEFPGFDGIIEGHLSHLLPADRIIILRCRPDILKERLTARGYSREKVAENTEAEILDVLLIETLEEHTPEKIYEIDATDMSVSMVADMAEQIINGTGSPSHGTVDWLSVYADEL